MSAVEVTDGPAGGRGDALVDVLAACLPPADGHRRASGKADRLRAAESPGGTARVEGAREVRVASAAEAAALVRLALHSRPRAGHALVTVTLTESLVHDRPVHSRFTLADDLSRRVLALGEPDEPPDPLVSRCSLVVLRLPSATQAGGGSQPGADASASLAALCRVTSGLAACQQHVSFRSSAFTRLLRPSLRPEDAAAFVFALSPAATAAAQTRATLTAAAQLGGSRRLTQLGSRTRVQPQARDNTGLALSEAWLALSGKTSTRSKSPSPSTTSRRFRVPEAAKLYSGVRRLAAALLGWASEQPVADESPAPSLASSQPPSPRAGSSNSPAAESAPSGPGLQAASSASHAWAPGESRHGDDTRGLSSTDLVAAPSVAAEPVAAPSDRQGTSVQPHDALASEETTQGTLALQSEVDWTAVRDSVATLRARLSGIWSKDTGGSKPSAARGQLPTGSSVGGWQPPSVPRWQAEPPSSGPDSPASASASAATPASPDVAKRVSWHGESSPSCGQASPSPAPLVHVHFGTSWRTGCVTALEVHSIPDDLRVGAAWGGHTSSGAVVSTVPTVGRDVDGRQVTVLPPSSSFTALGDGDILLTIDGQDVSRVDPVRIGTMLERAASWMMQRRSVLRVTVLRPAGGDGRDASSVGLDELMGVIARPVAAGHASARSATPTPLLGSTEGERPGVTATPVSAASRWGDEELEARHPWPGRSTPAAPLSTVSHLDSARGWAAHSIPTRAVSPATLHHEGHMLGLGSEGDASSRLQALQARESRLLALESSLSESRWRQSEPTMAHEGWSSAHPGRPHSHWQQPQQPQTPHTPHPPQQRLWALPEVAHEGWGRAWDPSEPVRMPGDRFAVPSPQAAGQPRQYTPDWANVAARGGMGGATGPRAPSRRDLPVTTSGHFDQPAPASRIPTSRAAPSHQQAPTPVPHQSSSSLPSSVSAAPESAARPRQAWGSVSVHADSVAPSLGPAAKGHAPAPASDTTPATASRRAWGSASFHERVSPRPAIEPTAGVPSAPPRLIRSGDASSVGHHLGVDGDVASWAAPQVPAKQPPPPPAAAPPALQPAEQDSSPSSLDEPQRMPSPAERGGLAHRSSDAAPPPAPFASPVQLVGGRRETTPQSRQQAAAASAPPPDDSPPDMFWTPPPVPRGMVTLSPVSEGASSDEWPGRSGSASPMAALEGLDAGSEGSPPPGLVRESSGHGGWARDEETADHSSIELASSGHCSPGEAAHDSGEDWAGTDHESDGASEPGEGARACLVTRKPIGLKLRNARVSGQGEPRGGIVEAVNIKSQLLGWVGAGDEVVAVQRLPVGAAAVDGTDSEAIWRDAPVLGLTQVAFADVMEVLKALSQDLKAGRSCRVFVRSA